MKHGTFSSFSQNLMMAAVLACAAMGETLHVSTDMSAMEAYEWGFAFDVMRADGGVGLNDFVLIEDDGPGAGQSEKGTCVEDIHAGVQARKVIHLDDATASAADVVLYMTPQNLPGQAPYYLIVNGQRIEGSPLSWHDKQWHWVPVPVDLLKSGANEIVVGCDAPEGKGYELLIAREDEYDEGGGKFQYQGNTALISANQYSIAGSGTELGLQPIRVGENSAKSSDGGKTWGRLNLGTTNDVQGEYVIRMHLTRHKPVGVLRSPVIDLWEGNDKNSGILKPRCRVSNTVLHGSGETPEGADLVWAARFADTPDIASSEWGEFQRGTAGTQVSIPLNAGNHRYLQWEVRLQTENPLVSPTVRKVRIERNIEYESPPANTFYVMDCENPRLRYSSYQFAYEDAKAPQLAALRERLKLDEVIRGAQGDFDRINRLRHFVSQLWYHGDPLPDYPEWNALEILDRREARGVGGMCIQFSITFIQSLAAMGYQARHVNVFNHETVEVYVDELGKWVHADPESVFDSYEFNTETGMPVNILEQHQHFLAQYGLTAQNPIDWMSTKPWCNHPESGLPENKQPLEISTYTAWLNDPDPEKRPPQHNFAGFFRMMPRNNYFSQPTPRPLTQGCTWWPWDGYLNWYDEATPRKLQYALHSDRVADFYPTLNQVAFSAVHGDKEGDLAMDLVSFTPNFETYEINANDGGWRESASHFVWSLNRSALNTLEMRTRNQLGVTGKPSRLQVLYHYREPFRPKEAKAAG
ncbi:MAG: transglutaminase domain-containing protein [Candidatus Hydrogenedentes bacterium]|nr:transglutaminase domain-containing protein [Candidatus Hydrogenedentota bacterium]